MGTMVQHRSSTRKPGRPSTHTAGNRRSGVRIWLGRLACAVVVLLIAYAATHLRIATRHSDMGPGGGGRVDNAQWIRNGSIAFPLISKAPMRKLVFGSRTLRVGQERREVFHSGRVTPRQRWVIEEEGEDLYDGEGPEHWKGRMRDHVILFSPSGVTLFEASAAKCRGYRLEELAPSEKAMCVIEQAMQTEGGDAPQFYVPSTVDQRLAVWVIGESGHIFFKLTGSEVRFDSSPHGTHMIVRWETVIPLGKWGMDLNSRISRSRLSFVDLQSGHIVTYSGDFAYQLSGGVPCEDGALHGLYRGAVRFDEALKQGLVKGFSPEHGWFTETEKTMCSRDE